MEKQNPGQLKQFCTKKELLEESPSWSQAVSQSYINKTHIVLASKQVHQWNRIQDPEVNPHTYSHLIFDKEARNTQWIQMDSYLPLHKTEVQKDPRPQHWTSYTDPERAVGDTLNSEAQKKTFWIEHG